MSLETVKIQGRRLGKLAPRLDSRTLKLKDYIESKVAYTAPPEVSWITNLDNAIGGQWPMMLNDTLGDCTCAAAGHMIMQWTYYATGAARILSDNDILVAYEAVGGYQPGHPETDNGAYMLNVLQYWRNTGIAGHKILGYASVDYTNVDEMRWAIQTFGNVYLGIALPITAQAPGNWVVGTDGIYAPGNQPGSWGGHAIALMAGSPLTFSFPTWNEKLKMSHNFLSDYAEEAYVVLAPEWIAANNGLAPSGLNLAQLQADIATVTASK